MAKNDKRFEITRESSSFSTSVNIVTDTETGVQYLYIAAGYGGGLTVLVDREGKPLLKSPD